jgi:hypothetical protein
MNNTHKSTTSKHIFFFFKKKQKTKPATPFPTPLFLLLQESMVINVEQELDFS